MLVLGEDDVEGSKRSDTILFVTVELDDKCVKVLALPRDTRVEIPGHGTHKLNSSFAYGGVELLKTTVENYLKEPILYYVVVNYDNFPKLVDAFGGVDIDVKKRMRYVDRAGHLDINFQPGMQHMDGKNALLYVRFRKDAQGDIGRVQRQQQFIKALLKKAYSPA
ncbi:MAG: LCP family protein, partial [Synergistaceae bacterium]|nr:LCP family protein [Candidatus Equadaptatus faecalis]